MMFVSIIICTYRRADALGDLLNCLAVQTYRNSEILIVDGSGEDPSVRDKVESFAARVGDQLDLRLIRSQKGLTRQRNVGLREARGEMICFFDDDVTFDEDFISQAVGLLQQNDMKDVGGLGGYDVLGYGFPMSLRHKIRGSLGFFSSWQPGAAGKCSLVVPLHIQPAFSGCIDVSWLGGFCMIYRREAVTDLFFDEGLPTFGAEDANFSMKVGKKWRLILCGDLQLKHHRSMASRVDGPSQIYECSYGIARNHLSEVVTFTSVLWLTWYAFIEFVLDSLTFIGRPSRQRLYVVMARQHGLIDGVRSIFDRRREIASQRNLVSPKSGTQR